jgi:hypothetical protein
MENPQPADQLPHPALQLIAARGDLFARLGSVVATWRRRAGKTFGPYYSLIYREDGRQRSVYLGRMGAVVQEVRQALSTLQQSIRQLRLVDRLRRQARASLRIHKFRVHALLRPFGLRLKGFEVRGWRTSPLRRLLKRWGLSRFVWQDATKMGLSPWVPGKRWLPRLAMSRRGKSRDHQESPASRMARFLAARDGQPAPAPFTARQHALAHARDDRVADPDEQPWWVGTGPITVSLSPRPSPPHQCQSWNPSKMLTNIPTTSADTTPRNRTSNELPNAPFAPFRRQRGRSKTESTPS